MNFGKRRSLSSCAVLAAGLWFSCTADVRPVGPQPTLRLDMTQTYPTIGPPGADTPIFYSTAEGQLVLIRGYLWQHVQLLHGQR